MSSLNLMIQLFNCIERALVLFCISASFLKSVFGEEIMPPLFLQCNWLEVSRFTKQNDLFTGETHGKGPDWGLACQSNKCTSWWNNHFKVESTNKSTNKTFKHSSVGVTHLCAPWVNCFVHIQQRLSLPAAYTIRPGGTAQVSATLACRCNRIINTSSTERHKQ